MRRWKESFALLDDDGLIVELGGDWSALGVRDLAEGELMEEKLPVLSGMLPGTQTETTISLIQIDDTRYIDIVIGSDKGRAFVVAWDASDKGRAMRELIQKRNELYLTSETLEKMASELTRSIQELHLYHAFIGHEVRNASQNVRASIELFATAKTSTDRQRYCDYAMATSHHLIHLVTDALQTGRLGAKEERSPVDIQEFVQRIVRDFKPQAFQKGVDLRLTCSDEASVPIVLDAKKLQFVLANLIGNALKFTPHGEVDVQIMKIQEFGKARLLLKVKDTGLGFTPEQLEHAFHPFVAFPRFGSQEGEGAGLGLFISKRMVEAMGGRLIATSKLGKGSAFTLLLPT